MKWLFTTHDGHFALLLLMLAVCSLGAVFNIPHALESAEALAPAVLVKLKSN